jgi:hypothetical protein
MKFKFIHIHIVDAQTRDGAVEKFVNAIKNNTVDQYFETMFMKKVEEDTGWIGKLRSQITGKR